MGMEIGEVNCFHGDFVLFSCVIVSLCPLFLYFITFVTHKFDARVLEFLKAKYKIEEDHFRRSPTDFSGKVSDYNLQGYLGMPVKQGTRILRKESYFSVYFFNEFIIQAVLHHCVLPVQCKLCA